MVSQRGQDEAGNGCSTDVKNLSCLKNSSFQTILLRPFSIAERPYLLDIDVKHLENPRIHDYRNHEYGAGAHLLIKRRLRLLSNMLQQKDHRQSTFAAALAFVSRSARRSNAA